MRTEVMKIALLLFIVFSVCASGNEVQTNERDDELVEKRLAKTSSAEDSEAIPATSKEIKRALNPDVKGIEKRFVDDDLDRRLNRRTRRRHFQVSRSRSPPKGRSYLFQNNKRVKSISRGKKYYISRSRANRHTDDTRPRIDYPSREGSAYYPRENTDWYGKNRRPKHHSAVKSYGRNSIYVKRGRHNGDGGNHYY